MKINRFLLPIIISLSLASSANAQTRLSLADAVARAIDSGPDIITARANLQKAQANLRAVRADPTSIITTLTQADQDASLQTALLGSSKINVAQTVISQYISAYETGERINLNVAQVTLDERNLQIAKARLAAKVATQLDVNRSLASLNSNRQELSNAKDQQPILVAQLARTLGLPSSTALTLVAPSNPPKLSASLASLSNGLDKRSSSVLQAANGVALSQLQVNISNNDYTPIKTLQDAQISLANAKRGLDDASKAANTNLRDAYRSVQDASEKVSLSREQLANTQTSYAQAQARLKAGTAAAIDVQQSKVQVQQAQFSLNQAQDGLWRALAGLSVASGTDVTGLVK